MPFSNSSQMMSVYEISWSFLDVFPGHSDLTPQEWTLGMCKCAVNFLPFCTNCLFLPNVQEEETTLMPESFWSPRWFYFACGVIQLCLKLVQLFTLVCKWKKKTKNKQPPPRQYFEIQGCIQIVIWINWRMILTVGPGGCSIFK